MRGVGSEALIKRPEFIGWSRLALLFLFERMKHQRRRVRGEDDKGAEGEGFLQNFAASE
jgi:hypothetical protein